MFYFLTLRKHIKNLRSGKEKLAEPIALAKIHIMLPTPFVLADEPALPVCGRPLVLDNT